MIVAELQINDSIEHQLQAVAEREIPFMVARALTMTAKEAQSNVRNHISENFTIRRKSGGFLSSIAIRSATKITLEAEVYTMARFAALQQIGGIRQPKSGSHLAVPVYQNISEVKMSRGSRQNRDAFVISFKPGQEVLARRDKRGLRILYYLKQQAEVPKRLDMVGTVLETVHDRFEHNFV